MVLRFGTAFERLLITSVDNPLSIQQVNVFYPPDVAPAADACCILLLAPIDLYSATQHFGHAASFRMQMDEAD